MGYSDSTVYPFDDEFAEDGVYNTTAYDDDHVDDLVREFDVDELLAEEGIMHTDADSASSTYYVDPLSREFTIGEDMMAAVAMESRDVMLEDVGEAIELSDEMQDAIFHVLRAEELCGDNDTALDAAHIALSAIVARRSFDAAMYEAGGFLPDTEDDWTDMVAQLKENQALEKAHLIIEAFEAPLNSAEDLMNGFGNAADKVSWAHGAAIRGLIHYLHARTENDVAAINESYRILSMLGDLNTQITANETLLFEERLPLELRMKADEAEALLDAKSVIEQHAGIVQAIFDEEIGASAA